MLTTTPNQSRVLDAPIGYLEFKDGLPAWGPDCARPPQSLTPTHDAQAISTDRTWVAIYTRVLPGMALDKQEIEHLVRLAREQFWSLEEFARAIEAAHGITPGQQQCATHTESAPESAAAIPAQEIEALSDRARA